VRDERECNQRLEKEPLNLLLYRTGEQRHIVLPLTYIAELLVLPASQPAIRRDIAPYRFLAKVIADAQRYLLPDLSSSRQDRLILTVTS
jgi:hypothetical protein